MKEPLPEVVSTVGAYFVKIKKNKFDEINVIKPNKKEAYLPKKLLNLSIIN